MELPHGVPWALLPRLKETFQLRVLLHQVTRCKGRVVVVDLQAQISSGLAGFPSKDVKQAIHGVPGVTGVL